MDLSSLFQAPLNGVERSAELRIQTWELGGCFIESCPRLGVQASRWWVGINYWRSLRRKRGNRKGWLFLWRGEKCNRAQVELVQKEAAGWWGCPWEPDSTESPGLRWRWRHALPPESVSRAGEHDLSEALARIVYPGPLTLQLMQNFSPQETGETPLLNITSEMLIAKLKWKVWQCRVVFDTPCPHQKKKRKKICNRMEVALGRHPGGTPFPLTLSVG